MSISKETLTEAKIFFANICKNTNWIFINLKLSNGIEGWGEATLNKSEIIIKELAGKKLHTLIDLSLSELTNKINEISNYNDTPNAVFSSAINSALLDLIAKNKNISLAEQIGGFIHSEIEVYANFNRRTIDRSLEGMKKSVRFVKENGFNAYKIAPFDEVFPSQSKLDFHKSLSKGIERIDAIKSIVGKNAKLMIDCHWRFQFDVIDTLINEIIPFDIYWLECPVVENIKSTLKIKLIRNKINKKGIKLAGLETGLSKEDFKPFLDAGCYDVMMPDVKYVGGPIKMLELAHLIKKYNIEFSPHNPSGPICHAHSLHICAALDTPSMLEHQFDESPLFNEIVFNQLPEIKNGKIKLSNNLGIGVGVNKSLNVFNINSEINSNHNHVLDNIADLSKNASNIEI